MTKKEAIIYPCQQYNAQIKKGRKMLMKTVIFALLASSLPLSLTCKTKTFIISHKEITRLSKANSNSSNLIQEWKKLQKSIAELSADTAIDHLKEHDSLLLTTIYNNLNATFSALKESYKENNVICKDDLLNRWFSLNDALGFNALEDLEQNPLKREAHTSNKVLASQTKGKNLTLNFNRQYQGFLKTELINLIEIAVRDVFTALSTKNLITKNRETNTWQLADIPQFYFVIIYNSDQPSELTLQRAFNNEHYKVKELWSDDEQDLQAWSTIDYIPVARWFWGSKK